MEQPKGKQGARPAPQQSLACRVVVLTPRKPSSKFCKSILELNLIIRVLNRDFAICNGLLLRKQLVSKFPQRLISQACLHILHEYQHLPIHFIAFVEKVADIVNESIIRV